MQLCPWARRPGSALAGSLPAAPLRLLARPQTLAAPGALAPWHTHSRGQVVAERFEDSLGLQTALAPTVRGGQNSFLSILCPFYIFLTWNFFFFFFLRSYPRLLSSFALPPGRPGQISGSWHRLRAKGNLALRQPPAPRQRKPPSPPPCAAPKQLRTVL